MNEVIKIPYLNPLRFHNILSGKFFVDTIPAHEEFKGYIQKFYKDDTLNFQVLLQKDNYVSATYNLVDSKGSIIHEFTPTIAGVYGSDYDVFAPASADKIISLLEENETYYIHISILTLLGSETDTYTNYISDPFTLISNAENTIVLQYTHDANRFDVAFYPDQLNLLNKQSFCLRVEGGLPSDGFSPESKDVFYVDQPHDTILLDSIPFNTYKYMFGNGSGIPNYIAAKINRIFSLNDVKIDGRSYVKSDGAKLEPIRDKNYPFAAWQLELVEPENNYSLFGVPEIPDPVYSGSLQVTASIIDHPDTDYYFTFDLIGDNGYSKLNNRVSQLAAVKITNLPAGTYTLTSQDTYDYTLDEITPATFTIDADNLTASVNIGFFMGGKITVVKAFTEEIEDTTSFHVTVTGQYYEPVIVDGYVSQSEPAVFKGLPFDTYVLTEDSEPGYTLSSISPAETVLSLGDRKKTIYVTNQHNQPVKYGPLYNWYAASKNGGTGVGSIAPEGWHVPTKTEVETLNTYLGGSSVSGGKLKETGTTYWTTPNTDATNETGFNGRGSGYRYLLSGAFSSINAVGQYWTTTERTPTFPGYYWYFGIYYGTGEWYSDAVLPYAGSSVRLIKDDSVDTGTVTDYDGNVYPTTKIGNQVWMAANLAVTHFNDGIEIPNVTDNAAWAALTTGAMCYYDNDINNA